MNKLSSNMPWVIFNLLEVQFAVSANHVREMVAMPKLVSVPLTPDYIRGVINLRGQVIPVMDLRMRMGIKSIVDEAENLIQILDQREQDHKNWIVELESSVHDRREFKLATDPHKCAFGKWYDNFKTDNRILSGCLKKFDAPHQKIHGIAIKVKELEEKEEFDAAFKIIHRTKEVELAEMIKLFSEVRSLLMESNNEIAVVLESDKRTMAVAVDSVETVEKLAETNVEELPETICTLDNEYIAGIGKRSKDDTFVQLLDVATFLSVVDELNTKIENN